MDDDSDTPVTSIAVVAGFGLVLLITVALFWAGVFFLLYKVA